MRSRLTLRPLVAPATAYPWRRRWLGTRWYWVCQLAGWGVIGAVFLLASLTAGRPHRWVVPTFMFLGGLVCTHLLRLALLRLRASVRSWTGFALPLALWIVACATAMTGIIHAAALQFAPEMFGDEHLPPFLAYCVPVVETSVLFAGWTGLYLGLAYFRGYNRAERERQQLATAVREAELRVLKCQINPHFLFNSLNTLRCLILHDRQQARDAVTLIADLLRASLTTSALPSIALAEELGTVRSYLALEQLRFEERLAVRWSVAPEALACPVPPSAVQSLVENALKHGIAPRAKGGEVAIEAVVAGPVLRVTVTNPGRLGGSAAESTRIGLLNTRGRLEHLCGDKACLQLEQRAPDLVAAVLTLPATVPAAASPAAS